MDAELMLIMLLKESIVDSWVCNGYTNFSLVLSNLAFFKLDIARGAHNSGFYVKRVNTNDIKELIAIKLELDWIKALNTNKSYCS